VKVIQAVCGEIPSEIVPCLNSVKRVYPQVELFRLPNSDVPLCVTDKWRWEMMCKYDDVLYIDWDFLVSEEISFLNNGYSSAVYFRGAPDNCLMYSPNKKIFKEFEKDRVERGISFRTMSWHRKVMRGKKVNEVLESKNLFHARVSGFKELVRQYEQVKQEFQHVQKCICRK